MEKLSIEDVKRIFKDVFLDFVRYYKFSFKYKGEFQDYKIEACIGGVSEDIYRLELFPKVLFLQYSFGFFIWNHISIVKEGVEVFSYDTT